MASASDDGNVHVFHSTVYRYTPSNEFKKQSQIHIKIYMYMQTYTHINTLLSTTHFSSPVLSCPVLSRPVLSNIFLFQFFLFVFILPQ